MTCRDNVNWLYNKGKKDKSVEKTAYIAWDESIFIAKCVLRNTAYTGYNMTYPSDLINDSFSLVDDDNVDVFKKTLGTAGETGYGVYDNKYVMYSRQSFAASTSHKRISISNMIRRGFSVVAPNSIFFSASILCPCA